MTVAGPLLGLDERQQLRAAMPDLNLVTLARSLCFGPPLGPEIDNAH